MEKRTFRQIALEIKKLWSNVYFGAKPYLDAMLELDTTDPNAKYYFEDARTIAMYFIANAASFRGPDARRIKAELKDMVK